MTTHTIYCPTKGTKTNEYVSIPRFVEAGKTIYQRIIVKGFRCAGKVAEYIRDHKLAQINNKSNWNGWGYQDHEHGYLLTYSDAIEVKRMLADRENKKKPKTEEDQISTWVRQMQKYVDMPADELRHMAEEKLAYKEHQMQALEERQAERRFSVRRQKLIEQIRRSNPLRRVENAEHAERILAAHVRHSNTDYEAQLEEAHRLEFWREWVGSARNYAHEQQHKHQAENKDE